MHPILEQINNYIRGNLSANEMDPLWTDILRHPVWYDYFITELTALKMFNPSKLDRKNLETIWQQLPDNSIPLLVEQDA